MFNLEILDRFSRPSIGGRPRLGFKSTASPSTAEEEVAVNKEVKTLSSGFGRNKRKYSLQFLSHP